jgi:hypothetical protein
LLASFAIGCHVEWRPDQKTGKRLRYYAITLGMARSGTCSTHCAPCSSSCTLACPQYFGTRAIPCQSAHPARFGPGGRRFAPAMPGNATGWVTAPGSIKAGPVASAVVTFLGGYDRQPDSQQPLRSAQPALGVGRHWYSGRFLGRRTTPQRIYRASPAAAASACQSRHPGTRCRVRKAALQRLR